MDRMEARGVKLHKRQKGCFDQDKSEMGSRPPEGKWTSNPSTASVNTPDPPFIKLATGGID